MPVPQLTDSDVKKLLIKMGLKQKPIYVIAKTEPGAILFECVDNVNKQVILIGGDISIKYLIAFILFFLVLVCNLVDSIECRLGIRKVQLSQTSSLAYLDLIVICTNAF